MIDFINIISEASPLCHLIMSGNIKMADIKIKIPALLLKFI
jgi:hypothetical protein